MAGEEDHVTAAFHNMQSVLWLTAIHTNNSYARITLQTFHTKSK